MAVNGVSFAPLLGRSVALATLIGAGFLIGQSREFSGATIRRLEKLDPSIVGQVLDDSAVKGEFDTDWRDNGLSLLKKLYGHVFER